MEFVLVSLALIYVWVFFEIWSDSLPDWLIHFFLLPGTAVGLFFVPHLVLLALAGPGVVYLAKSVLTRSRPSMDRKPKSNIPPPPG